MKAGWLIPYVDKRVDWQIKLLDLLLTRATGVALETSIAHYNAPCKCPAYSTFTWNRTLASLSGTYALVLGFQWKTWHTSRRWSEFMRMN